MWKQLNWDNLEISSSMLAALKHLDANGIIPSHIKISSYPLVQIFYYENDY